MIQWVIYTMLGLGSVLMVFNIYGFIRYARYIKGKEYWGDETRILYVPIVLLVMFLLGYLAVTFFGNPDLIVAGILFGGSVFVFIMYKLISRITERIIESEKREAKLMAAEEAARVKTGFLASVSHEMRTPMNVILGLNDLALKHPDLPGETREQLEKIRKSGRHLLALINNTLEMRTIEKGEATSRQLEFSLTEALDQVGVIASALCGEKGLDYQFFMQDGAAGCYFGDEMLLKEVLLHLLENAVKYTDPPGIVRFSVHKLPSGGKQCRLRFTVADTGVGMSPEFVPRAFDLFTQEDASFTSRHGGSGLGLAVAKDQVKRMGGDIAVTSKQHEGSTFTVTIPFLMGKAEEAPGQTAEKTPPNPPKAVSAAPVPSLEGRRILVVDDIDENAEIASDLLELEEAVTERAENGQEAVDMFKKSSLYYYDAVLMDLRMPIMDGLEAARTIRALDRPDARITPILALTANAYETDVQHSLDAGMNEHLVKPVDADKLYAALKEWIGKAESLIERNQAC